MKVTLEEFTEKLFSKEEQQFDVDGVQILMHYHGYQVDLKDGTGYGKPYLSQLFSNDARIDLEVFEKILAHHELKLVTENNGNSVDFGAFLKGFRAKNFKTTLGKLGSIIGVQKSMMSQKLKLKKSFYMDEIKSIFKFLGVSLYVKKC